MSLPKRIAFSGNDPGGAEAIAPVLAARMKEGSMLQGFATGPALAVFSKHNLPCADASGLDRAEVAAAARAFAPDLFLSGTSGGDSIDKFILASLPDVPSVYVLDFWGNYSVRFSREPGDLEYLPDRICAIDEPSRAAMLKEGFPKERIITTGNPHFDTFADAISRDREDPHRMLFVSQPVSQAKGPGFRDPGFDEFDVLRDVQDALRRLPQEFRLAIRLHPREPSDKFERFLGDRIERSEVPLEEALSGSGLIIGMFSPVLIQAAVAGKRVLSYEPGLTGEDFLPTNETGLTRRATTQGELGAFLEAYAAGTLAPARAHAAWVPGQATERVLSVLETMARPAVL